MIATSADINSGSIDNTVIGADTAVAGTFTALSANTSLVAATAQISDLTSGRIVLAGASGELEDSGNHQLIVTGKHC